MSSTHRPSSARAFTLVELLAAIFIMGLLVGILLPAVSSARNSAKNVKIKAQQKAIGDALEAFRSDNQTEFSATNGYPTSAFIDDPTDTGSDKLCGAMWLPRFLMGKDMQGFVPRRAVPPSLLNQPDKWYLPDAYNGKPLERAPVYLETENVEVQSASQFSRSLDETAVFPAGDFGSSNTAKDQIMILDAYGRPVLYYVANPLAKPGAPLAKRLTEDPQIASYTFEDNSALTGDVDASKDGWRFTKESHKLIEFGETKGSLISLDDNLFSFCNFILDKKAYNASIANLGANPDLDKATVQAVNRNNFILISAGLDGIYGSADDLTNFER